MGYIDRTLAGGEQVLFRTRLHWIVYRGALFFFVLGVSVAGVGFYNTGADPSAANALEGWGLLAIWAAPIAFLQEFIKRRTTEIAVTARRFVVKRGVFRRSVMEMNAGQIESVRIDQSVFGRLLGYGTIIVAGTGSGIDPVNTVAAPLALREALNSIGGRPLNPKNDAPRAGPADGSAVLIGDGQFAFPVVGESHHQDMLERIAGGRARESVPHYCAAMIMPQPDNPYDPGAVAVYIHGHEVGFLARNVAPEFLQALRRTGYDRAACEAAIVGGWDRGPHDRGSFGVRLNARRPFRLQSAEQWARQRKA